MTRIAAVFLLALATAATPARAGYFDRIELGARGLALGSAYGAAVNDVSAIHWNPAGLSVLDRREVLLTYSRPYVIGDLSAGSAAVGTPLGTGGLALAWHRLGATGIVSENLISVGYGRWIYRDNRRTLNLGGTAKVATVSFDNRASDLHDFGSETKLTGDLGLVLEEGPKFRLGVVVRNLGEPEFDFVEGGATTPMESGLEFSASYQWRPESSLHMARTEVGGETAWNYAGEIWFYDVFALRGGVFDEDFAGGFGVKGPRWEVDTAFVTHKALGNTYRVSVLLHAGPEGGSR